MSDTDFLVRAITKNGEFRAIAISTKNLTQEARNKHNLSNTATVALGRAFACSILLCNTLRKTKGHLILKIQGNGPIGSITVDANNQGTVRGYVKNPSIECFDGKNYISISKAVGKSGLLHVSYDYKENIPYKGSVSLVTGEIADDVVHYLATSEQIYSFISCGVYLDPKNGNVLHAGGIIIQRLPSASDENVKVLEETVSKLDPFTILQRSKFSLEDIIKKALSDFEVEILSEYEGLCFYCGCSLERFNQALHTLSHEEIKKIIESPGFAEGTCHFCNSVYVVKKEELEKILSS